VKQSVKSHGNLLTEGFRICYKNKHGYCNKKSPDANSYLTVTYQVYKIHTDTKKEGTIADEIYAEAAKLTYMANTHCHYENNLKVFCCQMSLYLKYSAHLVVKQLDLAALASSRILTHMTDSALS